MADTAQVATAASSRDPAIGLKAVRSLRVLVERLEALQVGNAREQGWTWDQIAQLLGVSRNTICNYVPELEGGRLALAEATSTPELPQTARSED